MDPVPGTSLSCFSRAPPKVPGGLRGVFWDAGAQMASEPLSPGLVAAAAAHLLPFVLPKIAIPEGCQEPALPSPSSLDLGFWIKFSNPTVGFVPPGGVPKAPQPLVVLLMGSPLSFPKQQFLRDARNGHLGAGEKGIDKESLTSDNSNFKPS